MKRLVFVIMCLLLSMSSLSTRAYQVSGTITGYSASGLKYVYMIPLSLEAFFFALVNPLNNTYSIANATENSYIVFAFQDVTANLLPGLDEPRGYYGGQPAVPLELVSDTSGIDIELKPPQTGGFSGVISYTGSDSGYTYIAAYDNPEFAGEMKGFGMMLDQNGNGTYTALADSGTFYAHCFLDTNFNFQRDPEEPYGVYGGIESPQSFFISRTEWPDNIDMEMVVQQVVIWETESTSDPRPGQFALDQNHPNPFNAETQIQCWLAEDAAISLDIFNVAGQKVVTLVNGEQPAGRHTIVWGGLDHQGCPLATGLYLCRLQVDDRVQTCKMILLR